MPKIPFPNQPDPKNHARPVNQPPLPAPLHKISEPQAESQNLFRKPKADRSSQPGGFITEKGSVYAYVGKNETQRFKVADGEGQGELHKPLICIFVEKTVAIPYSNDDLRDHYPCYELPPQAGERKFKIVRSADELPPGENLKLVRSSKVDGKKRYSIIPASFTPQLGTIVVEKWYNENLTATSVHRGHEVIEIIPSSERTINRMVEAGKQFGRDEAYFSQVAAAAKGQSAQIA